MKLPLIALLGLLVLGCFSGTIPPEEAARQVGREAAVRGEVANVHFSRGGHVFLNFGAPYPHHSFTAVVFGPSLPDGLTRARLRDLEGQTVTVRGRIQTYRGKPQIVIRQASQLK
jgi:exonuclease VII large subunit